MWHTGPRRNLQDGVINKLYDNLEVKECFGTVFKLIDLLLSNYWRENKVMMMMKIGIIMVMIQLLPQMITEEL